MFIEPKDAHNLYSLRIFMRDKSLFYFLREYLLVCDTFGNEKAYEICPAKILLKRGVEPQKALCLQLFCKWLSYDVKGILRELVDRILEDSLEDAQRGKVAQTPCVCPSDSVSVSRYRKPLSAKFPQATKG